MPNRTPVLGLCFVDVHMHCGADASLKHLSYAALRERRGKGRGRSCTKSGLSGKEAAGPPEPQNQAATIIIDDDGAGADDAADGTVKLQGAERQMPGNASNHSRLSPEVWPWYIH